ncbi:MAG TPA: O-methyltransferase [Actinomycetota bacterium]|nr:O-methyltransferase [Actinomycetota bacterium]
MNLLPQDVAAYMRRLHDRFDDPVLLEMEAMAEERNFPIVGRMVGVALEMLARSVSATRVFELGSGFGFSAWWFARAVGPTGEVTLTDGDAANTQMSQELLRRAGLTERCRFVTGDAVSALNETDGEFDIVYCDIDKEGYPAAFEAAAERIRMGGLYLCDNVLWSGKVADPANTEPSTEAIRAHNEAVFADSRFRATIIPIRDGVISALRIA